MTRAAPRPANPMHARRALAAGVATDASWLPDLCRLPRLAAMLALAELAVIVVALAPDGAQGWSVERFLAASAFALWLILTVSVVLCASRPRLAIRPMSVGMVAAVIIATAVALAASSIAHVVVATTFRGGDELPYWRFVGGASAITVLIVALAMRYFHAVDRWQAQVSAHARAEADALQARIRPHFLFNSMNMIASLVRRDPVVAERAVLDLADLFRAALGAGNEPSTLADEVSLAERYLAIEQLRIGPRLSVAWERVEPLPWTLSMPRLVLQPLVENAVLHGISRLPEGGRVDVSLSVVAGVLVVRIRNPAPAPTARDVVRDGAGHAQGSIGHRLAYAFGPGARMACALHEGYYEVELRLPLA